jgi:hypothetical protein
MSCVVRPVLSVMLNFFQHPLNIEEMPNQVRNDVPPYSKWALLTIILFKFRINFKPHLARPSF